MKNLKEFRFKRVYRTYFDNILDDFLVPALSTAVHYRRGVGYFSVDALYEEIKGLLPILKRNGKIQIITSPVLKRQDVEALINERQSENELIIKALEESLFGNSYISEKENILKLVTKLIKNNLIEIRIAYSKVGMFHEKLGIVTDEELNSISFYGSLNETYNAFNRNLESIQLTCSWLENALSEDVKYFDDLWNGKFENIKIVSLPNAIKNRLIEIYDTEDISIDEMFKNVYSDKVTSENKSFSINKRSLFPFQQKAIDEFFSNNGNHFFQMATGTGKTFTTIKLIDKLKSQESLFVIVLVPQIDLQIQWAEQFKLEGFEKVLKLGGKGEGEDAVQTLNKALIMNQSDKIKTIIIVAVYDTFFDKIYNKISKVDNLFIIIDEVHNISSNQFIKLPKYTKYRLGLSATPEKNDKELLINILKYFLQNEQEPFTFNIEDAIKLKFLSEYEYFPIYVHLDEDELSDFKEKTRKISIVSSMEKIDFEALERLANERSLILKKAKSKTQKLNEMISKSQHSFVNSVIYCGQGKENDKDESIVETVTKILRSNKLDVSSFTSKTIDRSDVLKNFEKGYFDTLVAIKCFDEGVDVPKLDKIYIMASDRSIRQTVQRRGRVLRKCIESGKTIAKIYDFVVVPENAAQNDTIYSKLLEIELSRVNEYMRLSLNQQLEFPFVRELEKKYNVKYNNLDEGDE